MNHFKTCVYCLFLFTYVPFSANAKIVFCVDHDIVVMDDDGTNRRRLTRNMHASYPRWSPDGARIAFHRQMDGRTQTSSELFIINADGTNLRRLTHNDVRESAPSWSPDGTRIAFHRDLGKGTAEVHVMDLETLTVTQLTGVDKVKGELSSVVPDWSPDGTRIVYEKFINIDGAGLVPKNIYVMNADGTNQRPLLPDPEPDAKVISMRFFPRWVSRWNTNCIWRRQG